MIRCLSPWLGLVLLACLGPGGCGGSHREVPVNGNVNVDGVPLREGLVRFTPVDGSTPTQAAAIQNGRFETFLLRTTYRVEITAPQVSKGPPRPGPAGPGDDDPRVEELIASRYNVRSELKLEVKEAHQHVRYDLESK